MSTEENKALIRRYYDELNRKDFAAYYELIAPDVTYNGVALGREGMRQFSSTLRIAFPDLRIAVEEMVAEEDLVAAYFTWGGTHLAELRTWWRSKGSALISRPPCSPRPVATPTGCGVRAPPPTCAARSHPRQSYSVACTGVGRIPSCCSSDSRSVLSRISTI